MDNKKYITIKELAELKGFSTRAIRLAKSKYVTQEITVKGGKIFEILLSSIESELQEKYYSKILPTCSEKLLPVPTDFHKSAKAKVIALARLDLLNLWKKECINQQNKTQFDTDFLSAYNAQVLYSEIYAKPGNVSIGTLQRWKRSLGNSNNYELLIPNYHYEDYSRTCLSNYEKQIFLKLLLHPNKFSIGKAISLTQYVLKTQGQEYIPAPPTFRRLTNWYKANYFDKWTFLRDGEKALKKQVIPHIKRDISKIEVGEVLVADGKRFNFQVINPFTGKPCRANRITLTHPLANYTSEINDVEDYKQKIQKQKQLENKTIKVCKEFLSIDDLDIIKCQIEEKEEQNLLSPTPKIETQKEKPEKYNPAAKPLFKTSRERYEYLMEYGCTCNDDRIWLTAYKESKEFKEYETDIADCRQRTEASAYPFNAGNQERKTS